MRSDRSLCQPKGARRQDSLHEHEESECANAMAADVDRIDSDREALLKHHPYAHDKNGKQGIDDVVVTQNHCT